MVSRIGDNATVIVVIYICKWFKTSHVAASMGVVLSLYKVARIVNDNTEAYMFRNHGLEGVFNLGTFVCLGSFLVLLIVLKIDG